MSYKAIKMKCCGTGEIHGLNSGSRFRSSELMKWLITKFGYAGAANQGPYAEKYAGKSHFVFTYVYGDKEFVDAKRTTKKDCDRATAAFKKYIERNKLGQLIVPPDNGNPNYEGESIIRMWIFVPDNKEMIAFCKKKKWYTGKTWRKMWWIEGA